MIHGQKTFRVSDRLLDRLRRRLAEHPYLPGSLVLHGGLVLLLLSLPGLGENERARSAAAAVARTRQQMDQTEARELRRRVERMQAIRDRLADAAGDTPPPSADLSDSSPQALAAQAEALSASIDEAQRKLRAAALARLADMPLTDAMRTVQAMAASEPKPEPGATPAEAIARLERKAKDALQAQRAQLEAQRDGVRLGSADPRKYGPAPVTAASAPANPASGSTGQTVQADGIPRSRLEQVKAMMRNGKTQGRHGIAGVEGGRSVNRETVRGVDGGWIAKADDLAPIAGPSVIVPGGSLDLTGKSTHQVGSGTTGEVNLVRHLQPSQVEPTTLRTGAGRVIGPGGAFATRVYLDSWYVIGPFAATGAAPIDTVHPPEDDVDLDGIYTGMGGQPVSWQYASRGFYPFIPPDRAERAVYYAYTELRLDEARDIWLDIAADDDSKLWLDGRQIWTGAPGDKPWFRPPYYLPDEQVASLALAEGHRRVHLERGTHRLLVKLFNDRDRAFFSVVLAP
ncbi:hypothetical protein [Ideonella sp.]|uniref:hypothetical protein n=1 Tax=Ideonella sp. TaxID=1929293 RepID=UPI0035AE02F4